MVNIVLSFFKLFHKHLTFLSFLQANINNMASPSKIDLGKTQSTTYICMSFLVYICHPFPMSVGPHGPQSQNARSSIKISCFPCSLLQELYPFSPIFFRIETQAFYLIVILMLLYGSIIHRHSGRKKSKI